MWTMILSLDPIVEELAPAFTQPSLAAGSELLLAWVMCLGQHTLFRVAQSADPRSLHDHSRRHGLDTYYRRCPPIWPLETEEGFNLIRRSLPAGFAPSTSLNEHGSHPYGGSARRHRGREP
jgi:hypothetical protein